jgi:Derlin-2/3
MGLLVFTAPYLPWVFMAFSLVMHGSVPRDEILGVVVGHVWYFFADVWPGLYEGQRPMEPPGWWVRVWERRRGEESAARGVERDVAAAAVGPQAREVG